MPPAAKDSMGTWGVVTCLSSWQWDSVNIDGRDGGEGGGKEGVEGVERMCNNLRLKGERQRQRQQQQGDDGRCVEDDRWWWNELQSSSSPLLADDEQEDMAPEMSDDDGQVQHELENTADVIVRDSPSTPVASCSDDVERSVAHDELSSSAMTVVDMVLCEMSERASSDLNGRWSEEHDVSATSMMAPVDVTARSDAEDMTGKCVADLPESRVSNSALSAADDRATWPLPCREEESVAPVSNARCASLSEKSKRRRMNYDADNTLNSLFSPRRMRKILPDSRELRERTREENGEGAMETSFRQCASTHSDGDFEDGEKIEDHGIRNREQEGGDDMEVVNESKSTVGIPTSRKEMVDGTRNGGPHTRETPNGLSKSELRGGGGGVGAPTFGAIGHTSEKRKSSKTVLPLKGLTKSHWLTKSNMENADVCCSAGAFQFPNGNMQGICRLQRWLLLLTHAKVCSPGSASCPARSSCCRARQLWRHVNSCRASEDECDYPLCTSMKTLISHHTMCRSTWCPVCAPVRRHFMVYPHPTKGMIGMDADSAPLVTSDRGPLSGLRDPPTVHEGLFNANLSEMDFLQCESE